MKRSPLPPRTKPIVRNVKPKSRNVARQRKEFTRTFHSMERAEWIRGLPCAWCGCVGFSENAHTEVGGAGMRAGYETIAPLCGGFHALDNRPGCHWHYDNHKPPFDTEEARQKIKDAAAETDRVWQLVSGR